MFEKYTITYDYRFKNPLSGRFFFSVYSTKHLCILSASTLLTSYLHQFFAVVKITNFFRCYLEQICIRLDANLASKFKENNLEKGLLIGDIWVEFSEQH